MSKTISRTTHDAATASAFMMNPQDRMNYVNRQMAIMDYNSGMNAAEERGEKRGDFNACRHTAAIDCTSSHLVRREELAMSEAAISNAYDAASAFMMNPQDRMSYVNRQMAIMDYNSGLNAAEERGEKRMKALIKRLSDAQRNDDISRAVTDDEYCNKLFDEFGL